MRRWRGWRNISQLNPPVHGRVEIWARAAARISGRGQPVRKRSVVETFPSPKNSSLGSNFSTLPQAGGLNDHSVDHAQLAMCQPVASFCVAKVKRPFSVTGLPLIL